MTIGIISQVAGRGGIMGSSGDGGAATSALLYYPVGIALDSAGNLFISDSGAQTIRKVDASTAIINTVAGTGIPGYSGKGGAAVLAKLNYPSGIAFDPNGNLFIADQSNNVVRKIAALIGPAATPKFNPAPGTYTGTQSVTISDTTTGAVIYYIANGSSPTTGSAKYSGALPVSVTTTIKAIAVAPGYSQSATVTGAYTIQ